MPAKHKNTVYKPLDVKNPFEEGQDKAFAGLLQHAVNENRLWRKSVFFSGGCFLLSLVFFLVSISTQKTIPVLVNVMPSGEPQYLGEVRQGNFQVPETAVHFQVRDFVTKLRSVSTDYDVVFQNIDDCFHMATYSYSPVLRRVLNENSPFELVGKLRRSVAVESVLLVTGRSYQINWTETVNEPSSSPKTQKYRAVVTVSLVTPTEQTVRRNPLGIYIENMEMTEL